MKPIFDFSYLLVLQGVLERDSNLVCYLAEEFNILLSKRALVSTGNLKHAQNSALANHGKETARLKAFVRDDLVECLVRTPNRPAFGEVIEHNGLGAAKCSSRARRFDGVEGAFPEQPFTVWEVDH